jgi:hypothetical protein
VERRDPELHYLALPTVCSLIYFRITGAVPDARDPSEMQDILNDVAHAISNLVPIYAPEPDSELPKELAAIEIVQGKFARGAHVLRTRHGKELRGLRVRRSDMESAISILKSAHIRFRRPGTD